MNHIDGIEESDGRRMTKEEVRQMFGNDADTLCQHICGGCTSNDWYCPQYCDICEWVQHNYDFAIQRLAQMDGDLYKFCKRAKTWKWR